ncbi:MAG TPA: SH3 domain-containing protein [Firmicutes bacterium]|nr:SH3 domain-containing protein [Bacillota bacterium]
MKRILCILLAVGMTVVFSGCSGGEEETSSEVSSAVTVEPSLPAPEPEPEPVYEARIVNVDQGSFANIREKPDISSAVIGRALPDETFTPKDEGPYDEWQAIEFNGTTGYVHKDYITLIEVTQDAA